MKRRDRIDSHRAVAPLKAADDAIRVDTDNLSIEKVLQIVEEIVREAGSRAKNENNR